MGGEGRGGKEKGEKGKGEDSGVDAGKRGGEREEERWHGGRGWKSGKEGEGRFG